MYNVLDVSQYIIDYSYNTETDEYMSNLKLQKILYYIQAAFLVERKKKCFDSPIYAWALGPVVPEAYNKYKMYGRRSIPRQKKRETLVLDGEKMKIVFKESKNISTLDKRLIDKVVDAYSEVKDPFYLVKKTHREAPWKETLKNEEISVEKIREYYTRFPDKIYS